MSVPVVQRKAYYTTGPRQFGPGDVAVVPVTNVSQVIDLRTIGGNISGQITANPPFALNSAANSQALTGVTDQFIVLYADGCDVCYLVGSDISLLSAGYAPDPGQVGTVDPLTGAYDDPNNGQCAIIPANSWPPTKIYLQPTQDFYLAFVGRNVGLQPNYLRIYQNNPAFC